MSSEKRWDPGLHHILLRPMRGKECLEDHYRKRSMLKRAVLPEDIAEAVYFLASDLSAKSTGNIVNVDAGNAQSFTR